MQDTLVTILKILAPVSVAVIVFAEGLSISPRVVLAYFKERPRWCCYRSPRRSFWFRPLPWR